MIDDGYYDSIVACQQVLDSEATEFDERFQDR
jgi:hypothetical protein